MFEDNNKFGLASLVGSAFAQRYGVPLTPFLEMMLPAMGITPALTEGFLELLDMWKAMVHYIDTYDLETFEAQEAAIVSEIGQDLYDVTHSLIQLTEEAGMETVAEELA